MSEPETGPGEGRPLDPPAPLPAPPAASPAAGAIQALAAFRVSLGALTRRGFVTEALVAINVLVFAIMVVRGVSPTEPKIVDLIAWGAGYGPRTTGGEWWRLLTATFLHIGVIHLAMNMYVLWDVGRLMERVFGNAGFLVLYVAAGLAGSVASVLWSPYVVSAGASGSVFGVYGGLVGLLVRQRASIPREALQRLQRGAFFFVGANLLLGLGAKGIDMAAHVGGLAGGFLAGLVLAHPLTSEGASKRWLRNAILAAGTAILVVLATRAMPPTLDYQAEFERVDALMKQSSADINDAFAQAKAGTFTDEQFADLVETKILPGWLASHQKLAATKRLPAVEAKNVASVLAYMSAREESYRLYAQGARAHDQALFARGTEKANEAAKLLKEIGGAK